MRRSVAIAVAALLVLAPAARALVINGGLAGNASNSGSGLPWNNVGSVNGASGVYLGSYGGSYWALTASHVVGSGSSLGNLVLNSGTFNFVPGSGVIVLNGDNSTTDLTLFRISTDPGLSSLTLSTTAPGSASLITYVAKGSVEGSVNYWSVTVNAGPNNDVWIDLGNNPTGNNAAGYLVAGSVGERWGQATVTSSSSYNVGTGLTAAFYTTFQNASGATQGAGGDSGGATFYYNGSGWELAGIMGAIAGFENQPGSAAVIGNLTFSASIANYNGFITSAIPEPSAYAALAGLLALAGAACRRRLGPR
ncbi:MAG: hypothetical protein PSU94_02595 [Lacunisphaera sp.]|nr:hypothetical protein [Lacunisphaera sp.]